jgi:uncharacterized protein
MKNIVGQTPRGNDFFPRNRIINLIYRRLDAGSHIFMAAPRRVGKTSIMRFLEDNPREGYHFVYIITEAAHSSEDFYQKLLEEILKSSAISKLAKKKESIAKLMGGIFERIEKIKLSWLEVNIQKKEKETFQSSFEKLIAEYADADEKLIIMIDEFPQTVENIKSEIGAKEAEQFLRLNREQRQQANANIRFVYTGSIGLPAVVKKLTSTSVINDLNVIDIPPLSPEEATELIVRLFDSYKVVYKPEIIDYLLNSIKWLIPFHIQLAVQELIDVYETNNIPLGIGDVDKAFAQLLNVRNDIYFEHYYLRLKDAFPEKQCHFALQFLDKLSEVDTLKIEDVNAIAHKLDVINDVETVLEALAYDGYIHFDNFAKAYRFNSYLLQKWWNKKNPHS